MLPSSPADLLIERIAEIGSTSTALLERPALVDEAAAAAIGPLAVAADIGAVWLIAEHQTGGRGRRGRHWRSDPLNSLAASLAIEATLPTEPGALTLVAGAAVARTLVAFGARPVLKWPNDIYLQGPGGALSKAGGILCESRIIGGRGSQAQSKLHGGGAAGRLPGAAASGAPAWRLVVGCGLNLFPVSAPAGSSPPAETAAMATALATANAGALEGPPPGHLFDHADPALRERLEVALGVALAQALAQALRDGPAAGLAEWSRFDLLAGQRVRIHGSAVATPASPTPAGQTARATTAQATTAEVPVIEAIARGIDAGGRLLVSDPADPARCRALVAEEVSIRRLAD